MQTKQEAALLRGAVSFHRILEYNKNYKPKVLLMTDKDGSGYIGTERRDLSSGRRASDTCSQHCFLVQQWEEQKTLHKEDARIFDKKLKGSAPLWAVLVLIGLVATSVVYTFQTSNGIRLVFNEKITKSNSEITTAVNGMATEMAIISLKQQQVIRLLEKHIDKLGAFPGQGIGAGEKWHFKNDNPNK